MSHNQQIIELVKILGIGELKALEEALYSRRRALERLHESAFKTIATLEA